MKDAAVALQAGPAAAQRIVWPDLKGVTTVICKYSHFN